jgi:hypothetical protein
MYNIDTIIAKKPMLKIPHITFSNTDCLQKSRTVKLPTILIIPRTTLKIEFGYSKKIDSAKNIDTSGRTNDRIEALSVLFFLSTRETTTIPTTIINNKGNSILSRPIIKSPMYNIENCIAKTAKRKQNKIAGDDLTNLVIIILVRSF